MDDKRVVPVEEMVRKVEAAVAARSNKEFFVLARTDALGPEGLESAIRRGERYLKAGADGVYVEGPETVEQLEAIGRVFRGVPLATSVLEHGGKTPWLPPAQFGEMGFTMILYPVTLLFACTDAVERAAADLRAGRPLDARRAVDMTRFEEIVDLGYWQRIEKRFPIDG